MARRRLMMMTRKIGIMTHTTSASRHSTVNMMASAPAMVTIEMKISSGPWCASSVISKRSEGRRLMSWPVRLRS